MFESLDVINDLLRPEIKGYCPDNLKEVISILAIHNRKDQENTPLKMDYIKELVPQGDKYLHGLIELGIIKRYGVAIDGQCYKYNFAAEYFSKYIDVPLKNAKLIRRIEKARQETQKRASISVRGRADQIKYLKQVTIDDSFYDFMKVSYNENTDQFNNIYASAYRIINGDIFYSVDNTSKRFHSNITNMAKELRQFLRIKGEPLVNVDIKNSQPYLSTILLTNPGKVSWMTENPAFAMVLQSLKTSQNKDVKEYLSFVISGQIYEFLMVEFNKAGLRLTRQETKKQMLRILFARNRMPKDEINRLCRQVFKNSFPTVHKIFSKVRGHERGDKFHNFKRFAILLQRIESYLMLDVILKRIYQELPGTISITIHDSIMTGVLTNNVEAVRKIMTEELTKFVGFPPATEIEETNLRKREENRKEEEKGERLKGLLLITNQYDATTPIMTCNSAT